MALKPEDIREHRRYLLKDGSVWLVTDFATFEGAECVQLESPNRAITTWDSLDSFAKRVVEEKKD